MSSRDVTLEIFAAGDGINYPRPGNVVTVHYTVRINANANANAAKANTKAMYCLFFSLILF